MIVYAGLILAPGLYLTYAWSSHQPYANVSGPIAMLALSERLIHRRPHSYLASDTPTGLNHTNHF